MMARRFVYRQLGLTMVELLTALAVTAVVLALAIPSFGDLLARKRVESVLAELQIDMQFARSEAVARNSPVRVTFGPRCYVIHAHPASAGLTTACTQTTETIDPDDVKIKTVQLQVGSTSVLAPVTLSWVEFDPLRGTASWDGGTATAAVNVDSTAGAWQLQVNAMVTGRVQTCSPGGSIKGFEAC